MYTYVTARATSSAEPVRTRLLQRKLAVGASNDPLEKQADRIADQLGEATPSSRWWRRGTDPRTAGQVIEESAAAPSTVEQVLASRCATGRGLHADGQRFGRLCAGQGALR
jgi:hypothetical protein